ncbi:leucine-rich repeat, immunoglobulin-like domain and transmembrane domain-containing protein 3 [Wyeomyia smithii]|uniref:leucine-rich repeat, immunoglobulin-like domain and transmembrane domain-containing protein 3 n=1 Tax=Wyeomyia smithii TaxID=174621 RepID=UPI002467B76E|nr:leucine-rich repeat, immunoglobulin-like domain and transmembrane domain-containing protein 3 [Wyeomyia smithii]
MHLLGTFLACLVTVAVVFADRLNICQDQFKVREGFYVYNTGCLDFEEADLAAASFNEDREVWVRNGTIEDIGRLLNGSLYNITNLKITNMAAEGSTPIPVFPIDSARFSILDLENNGIEQLNISEADYRLTHLDVRRNKLTELSNISLLKKLQALKADGNSIESISLDDFGDLEDLVVLSLANNRINSITTSKNITLLKLRSLDISKNHLTSLDVSSWQFPQLGTFYMHDNSITNKIHGLRGKFPKAWEIAMGGSNNWDCDWFDRLLAFLKQDRQFAMQMFGDEPQCPDQSRMDGFICCQNSTNQVNKN